MKASLVVGGIDGPGQPRLLRDRRARAVEEPHLDRRHGAAGAIDDDARDARGGGQRDVDGREVVLDHDVSVGGDTELRALEVELGVNREHQLMIRRALLTRRVAALHRTFRPDERSTRAGRRRCGSAARSRFMRPRAARSLEAATPTALQG